MVEVEYKYLDQPVIQERLRSSAPLPWRAWPHPKSQEEAERR